MASTRLLPCASCARHVRASESACPFCGAALEASATPTAATVPGRRLSRAALFALGASAAAVAACSGSVSSSDGGAPDGAALDGSARDAAFDDVQAVPAYGIAPMDASNDGPIPAPLYGAPPPDGG
jgi:hypothetical protein